ncbi:hypothetical protein GBAR_LOCUS31457 [Geodia barretti]|uniref:Sushi domain-containing protein n=1 Tax=Geodia barretti TaxID=519541 RepID=A0AA35XLS1_GEOBA|nr:hypothetical protein GBAR_LOCUS31457 [Geodia barretti]
MMGDFRGNFTSTLDVVVNDRIQNETNVTCYTLSSVASLLIFKQGLPFPPDVNVNIRQKSDLYYLINTSSGMRYNQTSTELCLTAEYNTPLQVSVVAVNCAGETGCGPPSPPVNGSVGEWTSSRVGAQVTYSCDTHLVLVGETVATCSLPSLTWLPSSDDVTCVQPPVVLTSSSIVTSKTPVATVILIMPPTAGCGPPSPPVNGSVGEWTSSRVGAQVTYSCDTHLVLVGETVATCSLPSLTWLPSSDDVTCVQPSAPSVSVTLPTMNEDGKKSSSAALSTAEAVATTGVVCVVCSFTAGLLLGVLLTHCHGHCHRKGKRGQTEIPPVYEDIPLEKTPPIELNTNEAYGHISHN